MKIRARVVVAPLLTACALLMAGGGSAAAASFDEPQALSPDVFQSLSQFPIITVAPDGGAIVAWSQYDQLSGDSTLGFAFIDPSGVAGPPVDYGNGGSTAWVTDGDGTTTLAWTERIDADWYVRFVRIDPSGNAGPIQTVTQGSFLGNLQATIDSEDGVTLAWTDTQGGPGERTERIEAARLSPTGIAGAPFQVDQTEKSLYNLALSVDTKDRVVLAWRAYRDDGVSFPSVRAAIVQTDDTVGSSQAVIRSKQRQNLDEFALSGRRIVVLRKQPTAEGLRRPLLFTQLRADGSPRKQQTIGRNVGSKPQIETDANGRSVVVWNGADAIKSVTVDKAGKASRAVSISGDPGPVRGVDLAMGANGDAVAAWKRQRGRIELVRFDDRGRPGPVDPGVTRNLPVARPAVGVDGQGATTLVWEEDGQIFFASEASG